MIMSIANEIQRLQTAKANIKAAIESKGVTVPSATTIDGYAQIIIDNLIIDPYAGHEYVEIGGLKWATMNVGANSVTDYGLYFQWGDTQGYTADQVGSGSGQKYFGWADYKYCNGTSSVMTKYNSTDGKTVLDASDDAARANWGGSWRMSTSGEMQTLINSTTTAWTADYQGSGVAGMVFTDKTDSSKALFFPAAGYCLNGSVNYVGSRCFCWSSSLSSTNAQYANFLFFNSNSNLVSNDVRCYGFSVRGVVGQ